MAHSRRLRHVRDFSGLRKDPERLFNVDGDRINVN